ncbi:MAG TPA: hypothetical protein VN922_14470 [Bacteroidia bacterium]|nr:hypothetical protein [Bacteroidia bacterium]
MSPIDRTSWNKILALCGSIGVPLISVAIWLIVAGTHLVDKVDLIGANQIKTDARLDLLDNKIDRLSHRVDTLANRIDKEGLFQQRYINGKLVFIPAK